MDSISRFMKYNYYRKRDMRKRKEK